MKRFLIADTHFGHVNIIGYAKRPFKDVHHMDEELIRRWNETVQSDDTVYVLGDFTLSRRIEIITQLLSRLNGKKSLIMGNHDTRKPKDYIACGFETAIKKPVMVEPGILLMHEPYEDPSLIAPNYLYFFGHVHDKPCLMDYYPNCRCVSVERIDYTPVDFDALVKTMRRK
jgi:calcineurin-like phosphoesterase family protein